jgi:hypothetical protein
MAISAVNVVRGDSGAFIVSIDDITLDTSYSSGGYSVAGVVPLNSVLGMVCVGGNTASLGYVPVYSTTTGKLLIYVASSSATPLVEFASTDLSALTIRMRSEGY